MKHLVKLIRSETRTQFFEGQVEIEADTRESAETKAVEIDQETIEWTEKENFEDFADQMEVIKDAPAV